MTKKEAAIIMAYTGVCMLTGNDFSIFHEYIENIMTRPVFIHELPYIEEEIKKASFNDFIKICACLEEY